MAAPLEVGPLRLWTPVVLAPMAGVTDIPFRRLCRIMGESGLPDALRPTGVPRWAAESGRGAQASSRKTPAGGEPRRVAIPRVDAPAGLYVTEMVTSRALVEGNERTLDMVRPDPAERVRSLQLYGVDPAVMARAATVLVERDLTDHVDLNFGCPVPKVTKKGGGAALPWKRDLFTDLVGAVVRACERVGERVGRQIPVTVKIRIGIDSAHETATDAALTAQRLGAAALTLHARTQTQHYAGRAHWEEIARLTELLDIPVFGNGDVFEAADALAMLERTGCDGVSVGRGAQGRPWLFRDIVAAYHGAPIPDGPTLAQVVSVIERHAAWCVVDQGDEARALREMRKHIGWYLRGFAVGGAQRHALSMVSTLQELHERLGELDADQPFPPAARGPRGRAGGEKTPHLPDGWLDHPHLTEAERSRLHLAEVGY
ncbi:putative TIM-barrel protein, nifR3 family [Schaalia meyeri]|nr:putative TIM-barrel protein, nifR3 family [Schaalia meyeri]